MVKKKKEYPNGLTMGENLALMFISFLVFVVVVFLLAYVAVNLGIVEFVSRVFYD